MMISSVPGPFVQSLLCLLTFALPAILAAQPVTPEQSSWQTVSIPDDWKSAYSSRASQSGLQLFRCTVTIPKAWQKQDLELFLEGADDAREVFLNGTSIGLIGTFPPEYRSGLGGTFRFDLPANQIAWGEQNVLSLKVYYDKGRTGLNIAAPVLFAQDEAIRLAGSWEVRPGESSEWGKLTSREQIDERCHFVLTEIRSEVEQTLQQLYSGDQPQSTEQTLGQLKTPDDLAVDVVLSEPAIGQPLSMKWDARGRLWLTEYLQYPHPAGLKAVSRDKFLRAAYDRLPAPQPNHFPGADRISIHEDTNGDGIYDSHQVFLEGLSLATSFEFAADGVYVLCPPYLLFYPDRDHNDIPDGDPEVLLEGFGIEDSHSVANSLRWGPDGWLYSTQGSTVSGQIKRYGSNEPPVHSLGQLVWRYHPQTRKYEIFAEGGGNAFGVEFDSRGHLFSGHNGSDTRGFHYVQGGYYKKGFGKHGPLSNPFTYGYFQAMSHHKVPRFSHHFVVYEAQTLPEKYWGQMFSIAPLQSEVVLSKRDQRGSTYQTTDLGYALQSEDSWVRPVDIQLGPDGCIYVADMYEQRIDHASHYQGRIHRESGRIYRLRNVDNAHPKMVSLDDASADQLIAALDHSNKKVRQLAREQLRWKADVSVNSMLKQQLQQAAGIEALELLWTLHARNALTPALSIQLLSHKTPVVREWTVRLIGDDSELSLSCTPQLIELAAAETDPFVRSQLACTARRLETSSALHLVGALLNSHDDSADLHIPLLIWWAVEAKLAEDASEVVNWATTELKCQHDYVHSTLRPNLMRRLATSSKRNDLLLCAQLLEHATKLNQQTPLLAAFEQAYQGRSLSGLPEQLTEALANSGGGSLELRLRQQQPEAIAEALNSIQDAKHNLQQRIELTRVLAELKRPEALPIFLKLLSVETPQSLLQDLVTAVQSYEDSAVSKQLIDLLKASDDSQLQQSICQTLVSRQPWSEQLLNEIEQQTLPKSLLSENLLKRMLLHQSSTLKESIKSIYGPLEGASNEQMIAEMNRIQQILTLAHGNPYAGKEHYQKSCATCHKLFDQGGSIGPDLTAFKRDDPFPMIANIVNPNQEIREGFENTMVLTSDGRALTGFIEEQDTQVLILRTPEGNRVLIPQQEIELQERLATSVMPQGLLDKLTDQQLRNLFAYLRSSQPLPD